jgi:hypothetical protein
MNVAYTDLATGVANVNSGMSQTMVDAAQPSQLKKGEQLLQSFFSVLC